MDRPADPMLGGRASRQASRVRLGPAVSVTFSLIPATSSGVRVFAIGPDDHVDRIMVMTTRRLIVK
jgi:hypothetical protein